MKYSFEPMLETIAAAGKNGEGVRVQDQHACLTIIFENSAGREAVEADIKRFMRETPEMVSDSFELVSGRIDDETATIRIRSAKVFGAYMASNSDTETLETAYTDLIQDRNFMADCAFSGVAQVITPRQVKFTMKPQIS